MFVLPFSPFQFPSPYVMLSYRNTLQRMEGRRNPELFILKFKSLFLTSISSFISLCLELPSNKTIKTIFSLVILSLYMVISLRQGNCIDKKKKNFFVNYKLYRMISSGCSATDIQIGFQLMHLLYRTGKFVMCSCGV